MPAGFLQARLEGPEAEPPCGGYRPSSLRLFHRSIQSFEPRAYEPEEVHVHAVGVHEQDCRDPAEPRPGPGESEKYLETPADDSAFPIKEKERDDVGQRRQQDRRGCQGSDDTASAEVVTLQKEGKGNANRSRKDYRDYRNENAAPECLAGRGGGKETRIDLQRKRAHGKEAVRERKRVRVKKPPQAEQQEQESPPTSGRS